MSQVDLDDAEHGARCGAGRSRTSPHAWASVPPAGLEPAAK
ncbi:MAG TPA: hypothetical protein VG247_11725 [Pseudonocardiaceae bacterium]|nr:hypothetical protein [Pseudonocardiaceae bacterium]